MSERNEVTPAQIAEAVQNAFGPNRNVISIATFFGEGQPETSSTQQIGNQSKTTTESVASPTRRRRLVVPHRIDVPYQSPLLSQLAAEARTPWRARNAARIQREINEADKKALSRLCLAMTGGTTAVMLIISSLSLFDAFRSTAESQSSSPDSSIASPDGRLNEDAVEQIEHKRRTGEGASIYARP